MKRLLFTMKSITHILSFESKIVWRSHVLKLLLAVVIGAGVYGIFFGKQEINKQEKRIAEVQEYEVQQFDSLITWAQLDTSINRNKNNFLNAITPTGHSSGNHFTYYHAKETPPAAALCLGQRDLFPVYYGFNVKDLARQVNVSELENPMKLLTGNFDLSYVIVFLCPLLIIGLFYDLYASEKEGGTLPLLLAQNLSLTKVLFAKGLLRLLIVWAAVGVLILLGFIVSGVSLIDHYSLFIKWVSISFIYTLSWTLLMCAIVSIKQNSAISAITGFGLWLILTLISPALINLYVLANTSLPNRSEMINEVRNLNDQNWGSPKSFVLNKFYKENPHFNDGDTISFYKFYYASFANIDQEANELKTMYEQEVFERNNILRSWAWLAPAALVQEKFSEISGTDRQTHVDFITEVTEYHKWLKEIYYQKIFDEELFTLSDLQLLQEKL